MVRRETRHRLQSNIKSRKIRSPDPSSTFSWELTDENVLTVDGLEVSRLAEKNQGVSTTTILKYLVLFLSFAQLSIDNVLASMRQQVVRYLLPTEEPDWLKWEKEFGKRRPPAAASGRNNEFETALKKLLNNVGMSLA